MRLIDADKALVDMWNALYAYEDRLEETHGLDVIERLNVQNGFEVGQQVVANAPTIEAEPKWIQITEQAPPEGCHILVTYKHGEDDYEVSELDYGMSKADNTWHWRRVIAWMPMPEPYIEVEE